MAALSAGNQQLCLLRTVVAVDTRVLAALSFLQPDECYISCRWFRSYPISVSVRFRSNFHAFLTLTCIKNIGFLSSSGFLIMCAGSERSKKTLGTNEVALLRSCNSAKNWWNELKLFRNVTILDFSSCRTPGRNHQKQNSLLLWQEKQNTFSDLFSKISERALQLLRFQAHKKERVTWAELVLPWRLHDTLIFVCNDLCNGGGSFVSSLDTASPSVPLCNDKWFSLFLLEDKLRSAVVAMFMLGTCIVQWSRFAFDTLITPAFFMVLENWINSRVLSSWVR